MGIFTKLFGTYSDREIRHIESIVEQIEALEDEYKKLSDVELKAKTPYLKGRLANGETLDDILPEAFATIREAADRVLGLRAFHVQLIGGIVLHQGRIAEMKTGEGKTLVATLPSYLNALSGKGVHIVTVNDYLAKYQGELMGRVHKFLGLSVGIIVHGITNEERKAAYDADITYGTNNEFGFDYLRDNMAVYKKEMVQRDYHSFAIVDEVDSILIDEARTPLIISGQGEKPTAIYSQVDSFAATLKLKRFAKLDEKEEQDEVDADYIVDEKAKTVTLTPKGVQKAEKHFQVENITDPEHSTLLHHINQAIRARGIMQRDIDYVVEDGEIIIIDEFTGRKMLGRRYSEGLHQAIEAKEHVQIQRESQTLATITFQNYFRLYAKLSGMTGTALTEEDEFKHIYKLDVVEIPTNKTMIREDLADVVFKTEPGKFRNIIKQIEECVAVGQPVLVGTISIEKSEILSGLLSKAGIKHSVLNAKHHEKESEIVAQAGKFGAVTIATNMAGRGTDIMLGGNPDFLAKSELKKRGMSDEMLAESSGTNHTEDEEILAARAEYKTLYDKYKPICDAEREKVCGVGGLFIIGTERHESRRIDNQLRGRAGRQGDPGKSRFYLSLQDDIMRLFGSDRIMGMMNMLNLDEDMPIENNMLTKSIENAQKQVESRNFATRKHVLEYDDVMNKHREIIYTQRKTVLDGANIRDNIMKMIEDSVRSDAFEILNEGSYVQPTDITEINTKFSSFLGREGIGYTFDYLNQNDVGPEWLAQDLIEKANEFYLKREQEVTPDVMREIERIVLLSAVDSHWMEHIDAMHELRQSVGLRAYGQRDPIMEYKKESTDMFEEMINSIRHQVVRSIFTFRLKSEEPKREVKFKVTSESSGGEPVKKQPVKKDKEVGRNDPCPCGSGKKYKKCCGENQTY